VAKQCLSKVATGAEVYNGHIVVISGGGWVLICERAFRWFAMALGGIC